MHHIDWKKNHIPDPKGDFFEKLSRVIAYGLPGLAFVVAFFLISPFDDNNQTSEDAFPVQHFEAGVTDVDRQDIDEISLSTTTTNTKQEASFSHYDAALHTEAPLVSTNMTDSEESLPPSASMRIINPKSQISNRKNRQDQVTIVLNTSLNLEYGDEIACVYTSQNLSCSIPFDREYTYDHSVILLEEISRLLLIDEDTKKLLYVIYERDV